MSQFDDSWRKVISKAWADPQYKQQLKDNPNKVLTAAGVQVPSGVNFVVVENEPNRLHLILPTQSGAVSSEAGGSALAEYNAACW